MSATLLKGSDSFLMLRATDAEREESLTRCVSGVISINVFVTSTHPPDSLVDYKTFSVVEATLQW